VDLGSVVAEAIERVSPLAERLATPIRLEGCGGITGLCDQFRLEQAVTNLLTNAVKYGAGKPVEVHCCDEGDRVSISVRDHGIGIAPEDQSRIFRRFGRAVSEHHYGGLGLGLWITKQIVERLGGEVTVTSEVGEGSTFTIVLPRKPAAAEAAGSHAGAFFNT
jgi:signal transduction histidine kinase